MPNDHPRNARFIKKYQAFVTWLHANRPNMPSMIWRYVRDDGLTFVCMSYREKNNGMAYQMPISEFNELMRIERFMGIRVWSTDNKADLLELTEFGRSVLDEYAKAVDPDYKTYLQLKKRFEGK